MSKGVKIPITGIKEIKVIKMINPNCLKVFFVDILRPLIISFNQLFVEVFPSKRISDTFLLIIEKYGVPITRKIVVKIESLLDSIVCFIIQNVPFIP